MKSVFGFTRVDRKCILSQEYERAVIFRLGRLVSGGAKGPGVFFVIPCLDVYEKIDMRTATYDVPPQEVNTLEEVIDRDPSCQ